MRSLCLCCDVLVDFTTEQSVVTYFLDLVQEQLSELWSILQHFLHKHKYKRPNHPLNPSITHSPDPSLTPEPAQTPSEPVSALYGSLSLQSGVQAVQTCPGADLPGCWAILGAKLQAVPRVSLDQWASERLWSLWTVENFILIRHPCLLTFLKIIKK